MMEFIIAMVGVIIFLLIMPIIVIRFRKCFTLIFECYLAVMSVRV